MQNVIVVPGPIGSGKYTIVGGEPAGSGGTKAAAAAPAVRSASAAAMASTNACGSSQPQEIVDLARALKGDPDLVYQHVYSTIDTIPRTGSLKGTLGTLIDRSGTAADQAELMVALLQQGGECSARLQTGFVELSPTMLHNWLGTNDIHSKDGQGNDQIASNADIILLSGGYRAPDNTTNILENYQRSNQIGAKLDWVWVKVNVGGQPYVFNPATPAKYGTRSAGQVSQFAAWMGYDQADFFNHAMSGATVTSSSVSGVNRNNVRGIVGAYANNLLGQLRAQPQANSGISDTLGMRFIIPLSPASLARDPMLPNNAGNINEVANLPSEMRTFLSLALCNKEGASCTDPVRYASSDLYGRRLAIVFDGAASPSPTLTLDGVAQVTGTAPAFNTQSPAPGVQPTADQTVVMTTITHPYFVNLAGVTNDTRIRVTASPNAVFVVSNGWGPVSRGMIEKHRQHLADATAQNPSNPAAEAVIGESLAMLGYTWLAEVSQAQQLIDAVGGTTTHYQHAIGIVGLQPDPAHPGQVAPYVDLPINLSSTSDTNNRASTSGFTASEQAAIFSQYGFASVLESGSIEQSQKLPAASTTKLIDIAAQQSSIVYDVKDCSTYYNSIRDHLNYQSTDLSQIDRLMGFDGTSCISVTGNRVVLPQNGLITDTSLGSYKGAGYLVFTPNGGVGAIISGGLSGGFAGKSELLPFVPGTTSLSLPPDLTAPTALGSAVSPPVNSSISSKVLDPINATTGAYLYSHDDLTVGNGAIPVGLGFQRSYDSTRRAAGPLGIGWTHNFDVSQRPDSDGFAGMAETSPQQASLAIAGFYVAKSLMTVPQPAQPGQIVANLGVERVVIASIIQRYVMDGLTNNIVQVTQPGQTETFVRNAEGSFSPPLGSTATLAAGNGVYTYRTKDGTTLTLDAHGPGASGPVTQLANRAGATVNFAYDGSGRLATVSNSFGRTLTLAYNGARLASVSDGSRSVSYGYDGAGRLASYTDPLGHATTYAYDAVSRMTKLFNPSYPTTPYIINTYDSLGRVQQQTDVWGNVTSVYVAGNRTEGSIGGVSTVTYLDIAGRVAFERDGKGQVTSTTRYSSGWVATRTLPEGNSAAYQYDQAGNVASEVQKPKSGSPLAPRTRQFTYEQLLNPLLTPATSLSQVVPTDRVLTSTDFSGNMTSYGYDAAGNLTSVMQPPVNRPGINGPGTPRTTYTYDNQGLLLSQTDPEGMVTTYAYYAGTAMLHVVTVDAGRLNLITQYGYDAPGNRTAVVDPKGNPTNFAFDAMRNVTLMTPPGPDSPTAYTYDADGRLTSTQRVSGGITQTSTTAYNPDGEVGIVTDTGGNPTYYYHDIPHRWLAVVDAENRQHVTYWDENQRPYAINVGGEFTDVRSYSPNGALIQRRTGTISSQINYTLDGFDRLVARTYPDGATEQFTYTQDDDKASYVSRNGNHIQWTYDALHRTTIKAGDPYVTYGYDYAGRLVTATTPVVPGDPSTGQWASYYDTAGRPIVTGSPDGRATGHIWDANGNQTGLCAQNKTHAGWNHCFFTTYDTRNRTSQILGDFINQGAPLLSTEFYDGLGRFGTRVNVNGAYTGLFYAGPTNDVASILHVFSSNVSWPYGYAYNRTHQVTIFGSDLGQAHPAAAGTVNFGTANALDQLSGGLPAGYDGNGNLYGDGTRAYAYDAEGSGRLVAAALPGGGSATYRYDPFGRRYSKTVNGVTTIYQHDLAGNEFAEYDGTTNSILRYRLYSPTSAAPVVTLAPDGYTLESYTNTDRLGSVVSLSVAGGTMQGAVSYQPFGQSSTGAPPPGSGFGYAGYRYDPETGLYYVRNRYYDPRRGRFLQPDPIRQDGGVNLYAYVGNDPLNNTDPTGLFARDAGNAAYDLLPSAEYLSGKGGSDTLPALVKKGLEDPLSVLRSFPQTRVEGELLAAVGMIGAISNAGRATDHIVLGLANSGLQDTAALLGGRTLLASTNFVADFQAAVASPATRFTISLDGLSGSSVSAQLLGAAQRGAGGLRGAVGYTDYEIAQLYQSGLLGSVNLVRNGVAVANPLVK